MHNTAKSQEALPQILERVFNKTLVEQMAGIPILNPALQVQTLGFQEHDGREMGIVITPWLMMMMLFPKDSDNWEELEIGKKIPRKYPSGTLKFMVNEFDEVGICQTHSLYSPMGEFVSQEHAIAAANSFLETLFIEDKHVDEDPHDEELLGRILRGEEGNEVDLNEFARVEPSETREVPEFEENRTSLKERIEKPMSRRNLLRGKFLKG